MTTSSSSSRPRLLIEEWLPAQAIGVECARERSTGQQPPDKRLHVWWARRPLTVSRAAVLGSLLPAGFDRPTFERLLGFGRPSKEIVAVRALMDSGVRVDGGYGYKRAFTNRMCRDDLAAAHTAMVDTWGQEPNVLDPMAGGGSIPLEAARLGLSAFANEYNPVACTVLEATVDYPFRLGTKPASRAREWARVWEERAAARLAAVYPKEPMALVHAYIFARTVPCPDTGHPTPLVPDWSLSRPSGGAHIVANPVRVNRETGEWTIEVKQVGRDAGMLRRAPAPTYIRGNGWSLFTRTEVPSDYIKAMAQQGRMGSVLYTVATKAAKLDFRPAEAADLEALARAERMLAELRPRWEAEGFLPTESIPDGDKTREVLSRGMASWADIFSPRQLLAMGVLVEELQRLRTEVVAAEGEELGEAAVHLLACALDKFANWNAMLASWNAPWGSLRSVFDRHDYAYKASYAELAPCVAGGGLAWAIDNVLTAYEDITTLPHAKGARPVALTQGSATDLVDVADGTVTAVVVDPPYADNVQYSELADFFYVWLKRTQGHRRPEWFALPLSENTEEAVVNISRHRKEKQAAGKAKQTAHAFYQGMMTDVFGECHRVLREDGVLTVMFTHKEQAAWADLFEALIAAGFTITATWPVQTENQHSLNQARKNAAQSTVLLVARKRDEGAEPHYFDAAMREEIRHAARSTAARLDEEGLRGVDQLVGSFGPAMEVYSRYPGVRTDTGKRVQVGDAIQLAADAVAEWRVERMAARGLDGVDPESRFVLLCWDVLGAREFRFNEAMLLGRSVGMDVNRLLEAGLVSKSGDNVQMLSAKERRRDKPVQNEVEQLALLESMGRGRRKASRTVHPQDGYFPSAIDSCHALALRYAEAGGGESGIGNARTLALQQGWTAGSPCARLMDGLVRVAPEAVRLPGKKTKTAADDLPEFRAWHAMLKPVFGIEPPEWTEADRQLDLGV